VPVVVTAGHVDHGKSTLVLALTGIDPDRFEEEKTRGLTIDLGFAWCTLPSGTDVAFVDVPGHSRFISNMLAGVGGVDACLFVVDTAEGWKPQSEEHLHIVDLLGVQRGVVALTKVGVVDNDTADLVRLDLAERVAGTFLEDAEVVAVDAIDGTGLDELRAALDRVVVAHRVEDGDRPRLWIDRAFAAKGAGTVVTGTLAGGGLRLHDELVVEPQGVRVRVRGLQSHRIPVDEVGPGRRVAVNLTGVAHHKVARGDALVRPGQWTTAATLDCTLTALPRLGHEITRRGAYHAHIGAAECAVTLRVLGGDAIEPGQTGLVRLYLPTPLPLVSGDRFVLRDSGRRETVGGGEVLDVEPVLPAAKAAPDRSVARVIDERRWVSAEELERLTGQRVAPTVGRWVASPAARAETEAWVRTALDTGPLEIARLDERAAAVLETIDGISVEHGKARWADDAATDWSTHPYVAALEAAPFTPPDPTGVDRGDLRELVRAGLVVERDGCYFAASAIDAAARAVADLLAAAPEGVTTSAVREALGTTRKYAIPLLGHLDATGVTRRRGDLRVAGPRLPQRLE
jgi:selenocysteine-specific elongation factor